MAAEDAAESLRYGRAAAADNQFDVAREAFERAAVLYATVGDRRGEGDAYAWLSTLCEKIGDLGTAREAGAKAEQAFREIGDGARLCDVLVARGQVEEKAGDWGAAQRVFSEAATTVHSDAMLKAVALSKLAGVEGKLMRFDAAAEACNQARRQLRENPNPGFEAGILLMLVDISLRQHADADRIERYLRDAADLLSAAGQSDLAAWARDRSAIGARHLQQAEDAVTGGRTEDALAEYELALLWFWTFGDDGAARRVFGELRRILRDDMSKDGVLALGVLAEHAKGYGATDCARDAYEDGLASARRLKDGELEAGCLLAMAGVDFDDGEHEEVANKAMAALAVYEALRNDEGRAVATVLLAGTLAGLGRRPEARQHFSTAAELYTSLGQEDKADEIRQIVDNLSRD